MAHLGNYFGAIKQYIDNQDNGENFYFIADYHALTTTPDPKQLAENSWDIILDYLAFGLDFNKSTIFIQSSIPEHAELCWILSNLTPFGLMKRAHAFKAKGEEKINVGTFLYPVLMAADILMYDADLVPVGKDQKQHVEMARDIAIKFNSIYGEVFKIPDVEIMEEYETVKGIDGQKMSKSYGNTIEIFAEENKIKKQIMSIVTDSRGVEEPKDYEGCNIASLYKLFLNKEEQQLLKSRYEKGNIGYGTLKKELFEKINNFIEPIRNRRKGLVKNIEDVKKELEKSSSFARGIAKKKIQQVRKAIGLPN